MRLLVFLSLLVIPRSLSPGIPHLFYPCICNIDDRKQSTGIVKIISPHDGYRSGRNAGNTPFMPDTGSDKNYHIL